MNKLSIKIFWVLFSILSIFVLGTLILFNGTSYKNVKNKVQDSFRFLKVEPNFDKPFHDGADIRFADVNIYTVIFDEDEIISVNSHFFNEEDTEEIEKVALKIIKKDKVGMYIGNLYFDRYSYSFSGNTLTIVDNKSVNNILINNFVYSIIILTILEAVFAILSYQLTKWITEPVVSSFEKQREFIADASHELKTPLSIIIASTEALEKKYDAKYVSNIKNESERMNKLIISLLDLAKSENKKVEYSKEDLSKIVQKSVLTFESLMFERGIKFDYDICENIKFTCNSDEIKELISILLDNAIRHTAKGDDIFVGLFSKKTSIELVVKNKGKAIKKEDEEKIFERFYKADKSRNRKNGTYGLGLAIAKNITVNHGGVIKAYSSEVYTFFKINFKKK